MASKSIRRDISFSICIAVLMYVFPVLPWQAQPRVVAILAEAEEVITVIIADMAIQEDIMGVDLVDTEADTAVEGLAEDMAGAEEVEVSIPLPLSKDEMRPRGRSRAD